ncbi:hypothetical protein KCU59_g99, partial [Aureobasidium melanogenum]
MHVLSTAPRGLAKDLHGFHYSSKHARSSSLIHIRFLTLSRVANVYHEIPNIVALNVHFRLWALWVLHLSNHESSTCYRYNRFSCFVLS